MHFEKKRAVLSVRSDTKSRYLWGKYKQKNEKNTLQMSPKSDNSNDPSDADFQNATTKLKKKVKIQSCQFLQKATCSIREICRKTRYLWEKHFKKIKNQRSGLQKEN